MLDGTSISGGAHMRRRYDRGPSAIRKYSIVICGHKTAVSMEPAFWIALKAMAKARNTTLTALVGKIDLERRAGGLSSAIRIAVLEDARDRLATVTTAVETTFAPIGPEAIGR
jgi:predicted DNA-binding ribbon-helix-helix protein